LGFDAVVSSTIPIGGGVSSSSALSVASALAFRKANPEFKTTDKEFFDAICNGEWTWSGVRGGIMDQFTSLNAKEGCAFVLDCRTSKIDPEFNHIPLPSNMAMLIANTNVKHELVGSPYNERRSSCERAVKFVQEYLKAPKKSDTTEEEQKYKESQTQTVTHLRDVPWNLLGFAADGTSMDARAYRRAVHAVKEDVRTLRTAEVLRKGDLVSAGKLLNECHDSLRDKYRVSCDELDIIVEIAQSLDGVYGARMMGGGFGGCAIVLVAPEKQGAIITKIEAEYVKKTKGLHATVIPSRAGRGARVISLGKATAS